MKCAMIYDGCDEGTLEGYNACKPWNKCEWNNFRSQRAAYNKRCR